MTHNMLLTNTMFVLATDQRGLITTDWSQQSQQSGPQECLELLIDGEYNYSTNLSLLGNTRSNN